MSRADSARPNEESVYETVVDTVARREDVPPTQLDAPLYEVVDPEALGELLSSMRAAPGEAAGYVAFRYHGYEVTVYSDGRVTVDDRPGDGFAVE